MIVIMSRQAGEAAERAVVQAIENLGLRVDVSRGVESTTIGMVGDVSRVDKDALSMYDGVEKILSVSEPYKLANRKFHPTDSVVSVGGVEIGGGGFAVVAGPCSVESADQISGVAQDVKNSGAQILRGGAFKPRSSPYSFQGLETEGLDLLETAKAHTGLPIVSEMTSVRQLDVFMEKVDMIQVGARNMQNFEMLKELGATDKPVLLKRGLSSTIEEWLMSAEYIMAKGNKNVVLCERGIRTFETATRNTLDLSAVVAAKAFSHLPVMVDPSHAAGVYWMVEPLALAAMAAGADALMVEVHNDPARALSDGAQSLTPERFDRLMQKLKQMAAALGRRTA